MRLILLILSLLPILAFAKTPASIAFYYGEIDSVRELINYDRVVVTPGLITDKQINTLHKAETKVYAYLSIGEFDGTELPPELKSASSVKNQNWNSFVMDLTATPWQKHLYTQADKILAHGFDGLFLDTLDSYYLFADEETEQKSQQEALVTIINSLHKSKANPQLLLNRGFEITDQVQPAITAVVAESLYHSYDPLDNSYRTVKQKDTQWLKGKLDKLKDQGIEAIVIDYIPAKYRERQKAAAKRLISEGYTPYVSDGMLYEFGVSTVVPVAKRVLGFYDGHQFKFTDSPCHTMMSMPIEYYGYVPECRDINTTNFSKLDISRYAAVFLWLEDVSYQFNNSLQTWLQTVINTRPMLFINALPTNRLLLNKLGITEAGELSGKVEVTKGQRWVDGYYPAPFSEFETYRQWSVKHSNIDSLINVKDERGKTSALLIQAPWGGAVLNPFPIAYLANGNQTWLLDPFWLIQTTLNLPAIPAADATTESARRILTSHVDGDGFPSKAWFPGKPYTAEVLLDHVFTKYALPHTVSVIEGEIGKRGLYPNISNELEAIARKIFAQPNVELASHTFSHPFFWSVGENKQYGDHLPIPGYVVDYDNEIIGSTNYINKNLAPANKKVKLILWSGEADPGEDVLGIAEKANLLNVNGGNTYVVKGNSSLTRVSPTIAWYPSAAQVYAPVLNENLYTNLWTEHHDGYNRAIETFEILGAPRRLKNISIYYHMYSGAYPASLKGLLDVYNWSLKQKVIPLYLSDYARRASSLYETGIAKTLNDQWQITSTGIKSIRVPEELGYPTINNSSIAGWDSGPDGKYLILKQPKTRLALQDSPDTDIILKNANGKLVSWQPNGSTIQWGFDSYVPFEFELANGNSCELQSAVAFTRKRLNSTTVRYKATQSGRISGTLTCVK